MKTCKWCSQAKPLFDFYTHAGMKDGYLNKCKSCCYEWTKQYRKTDSGIAVRKKEKQYPENKKRYKRSEKGQLSASKYKRNPVREAAKNAVRYAIRTGKLHRQPCFVCGEASQAHHSSYAPEMRLVVTWLCQKHHNQLHIEHSGYKSW